MKFAVSFDFTSVGKTRNILRRVFQSRHKQKYEETTEADAWHHCIVSRVAHSESDRLRTTTLVQSHTPVTCKSPSCQPALLTREKT